MPCQGAHNECSVHEGDPQTSEYEMWLDTVGDRDVIVCKVGATILRAELEHNPRNNRMRAL
jgi:hypothetical protein